MLTVLAQYAGFYIVVWVVVRVVTTLVLRFCQRCELSCLQHINMLGNVFSAVGIWSLLALMSEAAHFAWSGLFASLATFGVHLLSRKLRPIAK